MTLPWNDWFHCNGNTYGTWLPGDPRGWRSEHHKHHVEGDYRHPPPSGTDKALHEHARQIMRHDVVVLTFDQQRVALEAWLEALKHHAIELSALAMTPNHWHILARFPTHDPRQVIGRVKTWSSRKLALGRSAWGEKCKCTPVTDAGHFDNARRYILRHAREGAVVWPDER